MKGNPLWPDDNVFIILFRMWITAKHGGSSHTKVRLGHFDFGDDHNSFLQTIAAL